MTHAVATVPAAVADALNALQHACAAWPRLSPPPIADSVYQATMNACRSISPGALVLPRVAVVFLGLVCVLGLIAWSAVIFWTVSQQSGHLSAAIARLRGSNGGAR